MYRSKNSFIWKRKRGMKMNNEKKLKVFAGVVLGATIGASVLLAKVILTKETGESDIGTILLITGAMIVGVLISYLLSVRKQKRNGNVPEVDERTIFVMKNYFMWAFYFVFIGTGLITLVIYLMNVKTVEVGMLFVYQMIVMILVAIGAGVAKKIA